jgi:hypothetical protein
MDRLLYHEPYSIVGVASLFAGSSICDPDFGGDISDEEREEKWEWTWRHGTFSLGWWNQGERPRYGVDWGVCDVEPREWKARVLDRKENTPPQVSEVEVEVSGTEERGDT